MSKKEFLEKFRQCLKRFRVMEVIPLRLRTTTTTALFCPITAVYYDQTAQFCYAGQAAIAARDLKLNETVAKRIMNAADYADDTLTRQALLQIIKEETTKKKKGA